MLIYLVLHYLCGKLWVSDNIHFMNIQDRIGKGFGSREILYSMRVNAYLSPIQTTRLNSTPNYGPGESNLEVDYYR